MLADMRATDGKIVDVLRAPGRLGCEGQSLLIAKDIDCRRFAGIRSASEGQFRDLRLWQIAKMVHGGEKAGLPK
jgi:hypothetical protein